VKHYFGETRLKMNIIQYERKLNVYFSENYNIKAEISVLSPRDDLFDNKFHGNR
jgi:hypothetical protein